MTEESLNVNNFPVGYTYLKYLENNENIIRIKEITDQSSAEIWLKDYSEHTKTIWRKAATYPNSGRINIFRVDLRCVHYTDKRINGSGPSKNTNCPAKLNIVVKRYNSHSRTKEKDALLPEWPAIVTFKATHNHVIETTAILKYRGMSETTKQKLCQLFSQGYSPSSALNCLKTDLLLENSENYDKLAADTYYVPTISVVDKLYRKEFSSEYGCFSGDRILENLKKNLDDYNKNKNGGTARCFQTKDGNHYFVVICTPIMFRVHSNIRQCTELVIMVDAAGGMDKQRHRVYFFITPTAAGGLPIGVIITDSEKESVFDEALYELKNIFPPNSFYGQKYPTVFLTDNDLKERNPLNKHFPKSSLLLCQFHFLNACWKWLCDQKHGILKTDDRQELYFLIKNVAYSENEEEALSNHNELVSRETCKKYPQFVMYYLDLWAFKEDWASCYRQNYLLRGSSATNYVEVVFKILKDCILNRIRAFNLIQLVEFILIRYEMYMEKRLKAFTNGRYPKTLIAKLLPQGSFSHKVEKINDMEGVFKVTSVISQSTSQNNYIVDISNGTCSCEKGQTGILCSHASAVVVELDKHIVSEFNLVCNETKSNMFYIATGKKWLELVNNSVTHQDFLLALANAPLEPPTNEEIKKEPLEELMEPDENFQLTTIEEKELEYFCSRIYSGLKNQANLFVPAVREMLHNINKFASTETQFVSALQTFGTNTRHHHVNEENNQRKNTVKRLRRE